MQFVILFLSISISFNAVSQELVKPFSVRYVSGYIDFRDSLSIKNFIQKHRYHSFPNYEITITDSVAVMRPYLKEKERAISIIGSGFRSHTMFVDFKQDREYFQSEPYGVEKYLVEAPYRGTQYDLKNDSISILGYTCYKAVAINQNETNTVMTLWYAPSLPYSVSYLGYSGLPGLVLATEIHNKQNRSVLIAERITPETRKVIKPNKGKPVTQAEFYKIMESLRQKMNY